MIPTTTRALFIMPQMDLKQKVKNMDDKIKISGMDDLPPLEDYAAYRERCHEDGAIPMSEANFIANRKWQAQFDAMTPEERASLYEEEYEEDYEGQLDNPYERLI